MSDQGAATAALAVLALDLLNALQRVSPMRATSIIGRSDVIIGRSDVMEPGSDVTALAAGVAGSGTASPRSPWVGTPGA